MQFNNVVFDWLSANKISEETARDFGLSESDGNIVIPVSDEEGNFLYNKYRRSPLKSSGPKYWYDKGGKVELYAWHKAKGEDKILLTEGEKDCLVAWSHNIPAVTSTGGALSFQEKWTELLADKEVTVCFDNDEPGGEGMVRVLKLLPQARVVFIPDIPNTKDISDYVNRGGDLRGLLKTGKRFEGLADVVADRSERLATFRSVFFHDAYIKAHTKVNTAPAERRSYASDEVSRAKEYPIPEIMRFTRNKAKCPFHKERTASLHYYPKTNSCYCFGGCGRAYDAIDIYMITNNVSFKEAVKRLNK